MENDDNDDDQEQYKKIKGGNAVFLSSIRARISFCMLWGGGGRAQVRRNEEGSDVTGQHTLILMR